MHTIPGKKFSRTQAGLQGLGALQQTKQVGAGTVNEQVRYTVFQMALIIPTEEIQKGEEVQF